MDLFLSRCVQRSLASRRSGSLGAFLLTQFLFELGEFVHRDLFLLVHDLLDSLDFLDLFPKINISPMDGKTKQ